VLLALVAVCAGLLVLAARLRQKGRTITGWLARVPPGEAIILYLDFDALRRIGLLDLLALSRLSEEVEYRAFVEQTSFDARQDLYAVLIAFHPEGNYIVARGRFDWDALDSFVSSQGGACHNSFCRVAGSRPDRRISYFPLRPDVMALAVSKDSSAAEQLQVRRRTLGSYPPAQALLWALIPARRLDSARQLPAGTRLFAQSLARAEQLVFSLLPESSGLNLNLEVACSSREEAAVLAAKLRGLTEALRQMIAREKQQPNPRDLSGVLTAGVFQQRDNLVLARWPLPRPFLESLAEGAL